QKADNPRAVIGDNMAPDYAKIVTDRLKQDYGAQVNSVAAAIENGSTFDREVTSDEEATTTSKGIKDIEDLKGRLEAFRELEKEPHLRSGNAVDQFFQSLKAQLGKLKSQDKANGIADRLRARVHAWNQKKLLLEQQRRLEEQ